MGKGETGLRWADSGPHDLELFKEIRLKAGNDSLSLLNDEWAEKEKGKLIPF